MFVTEYVFSNTLPLSKYLQNENLYISAAIDFAMSVKNRLEVTRNKAEETFLSIFRKK